MNSLIRKPLATLLQAAAIVSVALAGATATAQSDWPNKPIRIVVPYGAGSSPDVIARLITYDAIEVWTNAMSTQLFGEFDDVMAALQQEIGTTFEHLPKAVFALRILNNPTTRND